ncbi:unnamed protein product, partial [Porites lobata]
ELHGHRKNGNECKVGQLAIINDKKKLDLVQSKLNSLSTLGNKTFWTGVVRKKTGSKYNYTDYQEDFVQMNSSLLTEPARNICNPNWDWCCLWANRAGLVKGGDCFRNTKYYFCER